MTPGRIVLLNGVGSAGKSSLARAMQAALPGVWLHVSMDAFFDMLPTACIGRPDGVMFDDGPEGIVITSGPAARRLFDAVPSAVAALTAAGNDIILDEVLTRGWDHYAAPLAPFRLWKVGVMAPLDVLEAREKSRGDRLIGLARWQYPRVHAGMTYDLTIDTSTATPEECARLVIDKLGIAT